jgi:hypothetical protein
MVLRCTQQKRRAEHLIEFLNRKVLTNDCLKVRFGENDEICDRQSARHHERRSKSRSFISLWLAFRVRVACRLHFSGFYFKFLDAVTTRPGARLVGIWCLGSRCSAGTSRSLRMLARPASRTLIQIDNSFKVTWSLVLTWPLVAACAVDHRLGKALVSVPAEPE